MNGMVNKIRTAILNRMLCHSHCIYKYTCIVVNEVNSENIVTDNIYPKN